jgi:hypothetical protein
MNYCIVLGIEDVYINRDVVITIYTRFRWEGGWVGISVQISTILTEVFRGFLQSLRTDPSFKAFSNSHDLSFILSLHDIRIYSRY